MAAPAEAKKIDQDIGVCRDLLCAEEWDEPAGRTVISEYHKDGLATERPQIEADLDAFEKYWGKRNGAKMSGEYHAEGAPHMEPSLTPELAAPTVKEELPPAPAPVAPAPKPPRSESPKAKAEQDRPPVDGSKETVDRPLDFATAEALSYAVFRMIFGRGLHIPVKKDGLADLDITVRGNDISVDTKQLLYAMPELTVWRVIYSHQGKVIFELGRGVKNGTKVHYLNAIVLLVSLWRQARAINKAKALKKKAEAGP